jgi:hypothetical protein
LRSEESLQKIGRSYLDKVKVENEKRLA